MNRTFRILLPVLMLLAFGAAAVYAQTPEAPPQINLALADLSTRLGRTITLDNLDLWRYEQNIYTDSALGCGLVQANPLPQGIPGYSFTLTYQGVAYNYRVSGDNSIVVPCETSLLETTITAPPPDVSADQCPTGFTGFLPSRLSVNVQARVLPGNAPNRLRAAPSTQAEQIGLIPPGQTFAIIGGPNCAESYVWWQVSVNNQVGWTAEGALPDSYFLEPLDVEATATFAPSPTAAPDGTPESTPAAPTAPAPEAAPVAAGAVVMAGVVDNMLTIFSADGEGGLVETAEVADVGGEFGSLLDQMAWSPDAGRLLYTLRDADGSYSLYVTDAEGAEAAPLADGLVPLLPFTFSDDGARVIYAVRNPERVLQNPGLTDVGVDVYARAFDADAEPELLGSFGFGEGCGGGSSFPGDWLYQAEAGYGARGAVLDMTPFGLLYTSRCTGSGTLLLDLETGDAREVGVNLSRVAVSPDETQVVGVSNEQPTGGYGSGTLTIVNLDTLELIPLGAAAAPDQVAWGANGEVVYSVREDTGEIIPGSDAEAFAAMGFNLGVTRFTIALHRVNVAETTDIEIFSGDGYAIGRLAAAPDGDSLYFSVIPNGEAWVEAIASGELSQQSSFDEQAALFPVALNRLSLATGDVEATAPNVERFTLNEAAYLDGGTRG